MQDTEILTKQIISDGFVAELRGIDLSRHQISDRLFYEIKSVCEEFSVVIFPGQNLSDDQQLSFTERFGTVNITPGNRHRERTTPPGVAEISNLGPRGELLTPDHATQQFSKGNNQWHSDLSFTETGAAQSILGAREVPYSGGETEFADMCGAYEALPPQTKDKIENLEVEHSAVHSRRQAGYSNFSKSDIEFMSSSIHPLVLENARTGRKSLYIGAHAQRVVGMPEEDGHALLASLLEHATQPSFIYSHRWAVGDLVIWNNKHTLHRRGLKFDPMQRRSMRRTTVLGDLAGLSNPPRSASAA